MAFKAFDRSLSGRLINNFVPAPEMATVVDIVYNEEHPLYDISGSNIGSIKCKFPSKGSQPNYNIAFPIDVTVQEFPLIGDSVLLYSINSKFYYSKRLNLNKNILFSGQPLMIDTLKPPPSNTDRENVIAQYQTGVQVPVQSSIPEQNLTNENVNLNLNISNLKGFEGDILFQNRYGASIRLGSSLMEDAFNQNCEIYIDEDTGIEKCILGPTNSGRNEASIVFRVGQKETLNRTKDSLYGLTMEDVNLDSSCFVMVQNQAIDFEYSSEFFTLNKLQQNVYASNQNDLGQFVSRVDGSQIILNSGRVSLNSKENDLVFTANRNVILSSLDSTIVDATRQIYINPEFGYIHMGTRPTTSNQLPNWAVKYNELEEILEEMLSLIERLAFTPVPSVATPLNLQIKTEARNLNSQIKNIKSNLVKILR